MGLKESGFKKGCGVKGFRAKMRLSRCKPDAKKGQDEGRRVPISGVTSLQPV